MIDMLAVQQIVKEAAKLFANREEVNRIKEKGAYDFVTAVDEAVQQFMSQELQKLYQNIQFLGEEGDFFVRKNEIYARYTALQASMVS